MDLFSGESVKFENTTYKMGGVDFSGKIDFLYKVGWFICEGGLGYKDGAFLHTTLGANFSNFELVAFHGAYNQYSEIGYEVERHPVGCPHPAGDPKKEPDPFESGSF